MKKAFFWVVLVVGMVMSGTFAYAQHEHDQMSQMPATEQKQADAGTSREAINVGNAICPVTGEKIDDKTKVTYEYEGKVYNFCCEMCIDPFKADPKKYIGKVEEELAAKAKK